jgi:hypothetical protein
MTKNEYQNRAQQARQLILSGMMSAESACQMLGIGLYPLARRLLREDGVDVLTRQRPNRRDDPSLAEIAARRDEIRASWSPLEENSRWVAGKGNERINRLYQRLRCS